MSLPPALVKERGWNPSLQLLRNADWDAGGAKGLQPPGIRVDVLPCPWASSSQCSTDPTLALVGVFLDQMISLNLALGLPQGRVAVFFPVNKQPALGPVWPAGRTRRN